MLLKVISGGRVFLRDNLKNVEYSKSGEWHCYCKSDETGNHWDFYRESLDNTEPDFTFYDIAIEFLQTEETKNGSLCNWLTAEIDGETKCFVFHDQAFLMNENGDTIEIIKGINFEVAFEAALKGNDE